jgi:hypothetical protein
MTEQLREANIEAYREAFEIFLLPPSKVLEQRVKAGWAGSGASFALDVVPLVSQAKALTQLVTGRDLVTGADSNALVNAISLVPGAHLAATAVR